MSSSRQRGRQVMPVGRRLEIDFGDAAPASAVDRA
jgi:hypothetical protein